MVRKVNTNPLSKCLKKKNGAYVLSLPETLPGESAASIADLVLTARDSSLSIDATKVARIDTPCIQILLSAARQWREDGAEMKLTGQSAALDETLSILGLSTTELEAGDAKHA